MLVDAHCHLHFPQFDADRDAVIKECKQQNIVLLNTGTDAESNRKCLELAQRYPFIKTALGIHPVDIVSMSQQQLEEEIAFIKQHASHIAGIGEIGMDFHHTTDPDQQKLQAERLRIMLQELQSLNIPFIIHSRKAEKETIQILEEENCKKVMMHCFTGSFKLAKRIEEHGWLLSIPAIILRSLQFQGLVNQTGLANLLTETDAPFLAPPPKQRADPTMVKQTVQKIAELKGVDVAFVEKTIAANFTKYFG